MSGHCGHGHGKGHIEKIKERNFLTRDNSLLLTIDIQDRLAKAMFNREQLIKNSKILIELSNLYNIPMIFTEQNPKSLGNTNEELLATAKDYSVVEKMEFSAFTPKLQELLEKSGRKNIIVTGMETHVCVYQTVRDLIINGYNVTLVSDAVSSRSEFNYKNALDLMSKINSVISNTETVLFDVVNTSSDPNFKEAQKLIK